MGLISKQDYFRLGARSAYVCERLFDRAWQLTGEWHEAIGEFHADWHAMSGARRQAGRERRAMQDVGREGGVDRGSLRMDVRLPRIPDVLPEVPSVPSASSR